MPNLNSYQGREQTYVKHFVLKHYLERVAYNIYSFQDNFVYVDGFSGPWKSGNIDYNDTSFKIATDQLIAVRDGMEARGRKVQIRCMFIEKSAQSFKELQSAVNGIHALDDIGLINGAFEDNIQKILDFIGNDFSLVFIDPTGWQGFPMGKISPLLKLKGEVLINFMSDFINRFIEDPRPEIAKSFDDLFGSNWYDDWRKLHEGGLSREAAAIDVYSSRLKEIGGFKFVTSTRILKPLRDRSYFYLIYATRHWKGIQEFRFVEKKAIQEQDRVRNIAKYNASVRKTGQEGLFGPNLAATVQSFEDERQIQLSRGYDRMLLMLKNCKGGILYEDLLGYVLEVPLVWESDLKDWIAELRQEGQIEIPQLTGRARVPKKGYVLIYRL